MATDRVGVAAGAVPQWYVVHAYSGHEDKVKKNLEKRIESMDMHDQILEVFVPMEDEIEIKDGKRRHVQKRIYPGYILVKMIISDESCYVVRTTPGVTCFVGSGTQPVPLHETEPKSILKEVKRSYNERTAAQAGDVIAAEITIFEDRSFTFVLRTPPTVNLLKKAAGIEKGSPSARKEKVGKVTRAQLVSIADVKAKDLTSY